MIPACSVSPVLPAVSSDSAEDGGEIGGDDEFAAAGSDDERDVDERRELVPDRAGDSGEGQEEALRRRPLPTRTSAPSGRRGTARAWP